LVPFHPGEANSGEAKAEMVVRSDVKKLTACREVAGLYKPRRTKSRTNDIAKTQAAEPLLALSV
jgi:hypothetical protein